MQFAIIGIIVFILLMMVLAVLNTMRNTDEEDEAIDNIYDMRRTQSFNDFRKIAIKQKLEKILEQRLPIDKRLKKQETIAQAGFDVTVGELGLISWFIAIIAAVISFALMQNLLFMPVMGFISYFIPITLIEFVRNRRQLKLEKQVGSCIKLLTERYSSHGDFTKAFNDTTTDFRGQEPIYMELRKSQLELDAGISVNEVLSGLYRRIGNPYLRMFAQFYEMASKLGTRDARKDLLGEVYKQFRENEVHKSMLRKEISGPKREAFIMVGVIPIMMGYQMMFSGEYQEFMFNTTVGQVGLVFIVSVVLGAVWFINKKIGAPLD